MSKWVLLALSVAAILVVRYFVRAADMIRRSPVRDPDFDKKIMHLPDDKRHERAEWAKNYLPGRGVTMAIAIAVYLVYETIKAFNE